MIKVGTVIIFILLVLSAAYSIVDIVEPRIVLEGDFQAVAGKSFEDSLEPGALKVSLLHLRHLMVFSLTTAIACFFILLAGFRKAERWAWWALLIVGGIAWGYGTIVNIVIGNMFDFTVFLVGLVIFFVGLFLPIKAFFRKEV